MTETEPITESHEMDRQLAAIASTMGFRDRLYLIWKNLLNWRVIVKFYQIKRRYSV